MQHVHTYVHHHRRITIHIRTSLRSCARCTVQGDDSSTPLPTCFLCPPLRMLALCGCCQVPRRQLRLPWQPKANTLKYQRIHRSADWRFTLIGRDSLVCQMPAFLSVCICSWVCVFEYMYVPYIHTYICVYVRTCVSECTHKCLTLWMSLKASVRTEVYPA